MADIRQYPFEDPLPRGAVLEDTVRIDIQRPFPVTPPWGSGGPSSENLASPVPGGYEMTPTLNYANYTMAPVRYLDNRIQFFRYSIHRLGGMGPFRLVYRGQIDNPDCCELTQEGAWLGAWVKQPDRTDYCLWYKGIIEKCSHQRIMQEDYTILEGQGLLGYLNRVVVNRSYTYMRIRDIVTDIIQGLVRPLTRVKYDGNLIQTGDYVVKNFNPHTTALRAIRILAELQGDTDWGVLQSGKFYFVPTATIVQDNAHLVIEKDMSDVHTACVQDIPNRIFAEGEDFGEYIYQKEYISSSARENRGSFDEYAYVTALGHPDDIARWVSFRFVENAEPRNYAIGRQTPVAYDFCLNPPWSRFRLRSQDGYYDQEFRFGKLVMTHGGKKRAGSVEFSGSANQSNTTPSQMTGEFSLGKYSKDLAEELEVFDHRIDNIRMRDAQRKENQVDAALTHYGSVGEAPTTEIVDASGLKVKVFHFLHKCAEVYRGHTRNFTRAKGIEIGIALKFVLSAAIPAGKNIDLLITCKLIRKSVAGANDTLTKVRRILLNTEATGLKGNNYTLVPLTCDVMYLTYEEIKQEAEMQITIDRKTAELQDDFDGDFHLAEVHANLRKQSHPARVSAGRIGVSRVNQQWL